MTRDGALRRRLEPLLHATERSQPELLTEATALAADVVGCRLAAVSLVGPDGPERHPAGEAADWVDTCDAAQAAIETVLQQSTTIRLPTAGLDSRAAALLAVPVLLRGRSAGALLLADPHERDEFTGDDERAALEIASAIATVVERARTAAENRRRDRWLSGAAELTRELVSFDQPDPLRLICQRLLPIADADLVSILQPDEASESLVVAAAAGPAAPHWTGQLLSPAHSLITSVHTDVKPAGVAHLAQADLLPAEVVARLGVDGLILVPLAGSGGSRGVLMIGRGPGRRAFSAAELGVATMFAGQVALALELADSQARRDQLALIEERDRIARDLHDHVIQRLFAVGLALQNASAELPAELAERLHSGVDELDETIKQIRATIYRLTGPIVASRTSLRTRAAQLLDDVEPLLGFRPTLELAGAVDFGVGEDVAHDCIAVLREALSNVARHARATAADVLISVGQEAITLEVSDDGRGIGESTRRSGLANLRTRAERRGGSLAVESGRGTRLVWTIPVETEA